jgi:SAM-dependent methyltransferase
MAGGGERALGEVVMNDMQAADLERDARLAREAAFHDTRFAENTRAATDKFYAITRSSFAFYRKRVLDDVVGKALLEYGCGTGSSAFDAAAAGAHATGIDISPVAIEMGAQEAVARGLGDRTHFAVMNAEALDFPDASFDRVCGSGILHHLDLRKAYAEIARVLRPGGYGIFLEPLGHNPLINWYRRRTPEMRTEDEHPLLKSDLALARQYFSSIRSRFFHFAALGAVPLRRSFLFKPAVAIGEGIDRLLLSSVSPLRNQAWMVVTELHK